MIDVNAYPLDFHPEEADIVIGIGESASSDVGETLSTDGIGPCIAIALFCPNPAVGYLTHSYQYEATRQIDDIPVSFLNNTTKAWLVGGCYVSEIPNPREAAHKNRDDTVELLIKLGVVRRNITTVWLDDQYHAAAIVLDTGSGECRIGIDDSALDFIGLYDLDDDR